MRLKLMVVEAFDVRISVSRVIYVGCGHACFKRGRAYLRLQRLGHSKFRRSFVKRESNFLLGTTVFVHQLSFDPSDIERRIEFCGVTLFLFCVISERERKRNLISSLGIINLIIWKRFGKEEARRKNVNIFFFFKEQYR